MHRDDKVQLKKTTTTTTKQTNKQTNKQVVSL
jgi:hypothetical protein